MHCGRGDRLHPVFVTLWVFRLNWGHEEEDRDPSIRCHYVCRRRRWHWCPLWNGNDYDSTEQGSDICVFIRRCLPVNRQTWPGKSKRAEVREGFISVFFYSRGPVVRPLWKIISLTRPLRLVEGIYGRVNSIRHRPLGKEHSTVILFHMSHWCLGSQKTWCD